MALVPQSNIQPNQESEIYLRIGKTVLNQEKDEFEFVSIPSIVGIDTMRKNKVVGQSDYAKMLASGNKLLEDLLKIASTLQAGESKSIKLEVQLCRRKAKEEQNFVLPTFDLL